VKSSYMIDGNYTRSIPVKWAEIDTVIWLDLSFYLNISIGQLREHFRAISK